MARKSMIETSDDIAQHLERLHADIATLSRTVARLASESAASAKLQAHEAASGAARKANDAGQEIYRDAATIGKDAINIAQAASGQLEAQIARNPMMALLAALGVGFAAGLLSCRRA